MGTRGRGALLTREAREKALKTRKRLPWKKAGLSRVARVIAFLEYLPVTKGKLAGQKMKLLPDQRRFVADVYGRRVRLAVKSEPRGNGKTGLLAGLSLCHLLGPEAEVRGEVYSAAIDRMQAALMFNEMEAIIVRVQDFAARVNVQRFHKKIEVLEGDGEGSTYEALSADARRAHGLAPSLWVYDELAQAKNRELLDNLQTAMGVVHLTSAPEDADPFDPETIWSVNPAIGIFLDEATFLLRPSARAGYRHSSRRSEIFGSISASMRGRTSAWSPRRCGRAARCRSIARRWPSGLASRRWTYQASTT
jgi:phage terminase large subunit-like protein